MFRQLNINQVRNIDSLYSGENIEINRNLIDKKGNEDSQESKKQDTKQCEKKEDNNENKHVSSSSNKKTSKSDHRSKDDHKSSHGSKQSSWVSNMREYRVQLDKYNRFRRSVSVEPRTYKRQQNRLSFIQKNHYNRRPPNNKQWRNNDNYDRWNQKRGGYRNNQRRNNNRQRLHRNLCYDDEDDQGDLDMPPPSNQVFLPNNQNFPPPTFNSRPPLLPIPPPMMMLPPPSLPPPPPPHIMFDMPPPPVPPLLKTSVEIKPSEAVQKEKYEHNKMLAEKRNEHLAKEKVLYEDLHKLQRQRSKILKQHHGNNSAQNNKIVKENEKLQDELRKKIEATESAIKMLTEIIGDRLRHSPPRIGESNSENSSDSSEDEEDSHSDDSTSHSSDETTMTEEFVKPMPRKNNYRISRNRNIFVRKKDITTRNRRNIDTSTFIQLAGQKVLKTKESETLEAKSKSMEMKLHEDTDNEDIFPLASSVGAAPAPNTMEEDIEEIFNLRQPSNERSISPVEKEDANTKREGDENSQVPKRKSPTTVIEEILLDGNEDLSKIDDETMRRHRRNIQITLKKKPSKPPKIKQPSEKSKQNEEQSKRTEEEDEETIRNKENKIDNKENEIVIQIIDNEKNSPELVPVKELPDSNQFNPSGYWCRLCDIDFSEDSDYLSHLHSREHTDNFKEKEQSWHESTPCTSPPLLTEESKERLSKATHMLIPVNGWYCKLCRIWMGDINCATSHVRHDRHFSKFEDFNQSNPMWEINWLKDKSEAFQKRIEDQTSKGNSTSYRNTSSAIIISQNKNKIFNEEESGEEEKNKLWVPNRKEFNKISQNCSQQLENSGTKTKKKPNFIGKMPQGKIKINVATSQQTSSDCNLDGVQENTIDPHWEENEISRIDGKEINNFDKNLVESVTNILNQLNTIQNRHELNLEPIHNIKEPTLFLNTNSEELVLFNKENFDRKSSDISNEKICSSDKICDESQSNEHITESLANSRTRDSEANENKLSDTIQEDEMDIKNIQLPAGKPKVVKEIIEKECISNRFVRNENLEVSSSTNETIPKSKVKNYKKYHGNTNTIIQSLHSRYNENDQSHSDNDSDNSDRSQNKEMSGEKYKNNQSFKDKYRKLNEKVEFNKQIDYDSDSNKRDNQRLNESNHSQSDSDHNENTNKLRNKNKYHSNSDSDNRENIQRNKVMSKDKDESSSDSDSSENDNKSRNENKYKSNSDSDNSKNDNKIRNERKYENNSDSDNSKSGKIRNKNTYESNSDSDNRKNDNKIRNRNKYESNSDSDNSNNDNKIRNKNKDVNNSDSDHSANDNKSKIRCGNTDEMESDSDSQSIDIQREYINYDFDYDSSNEKENMKFYEKKRNKVGKKRRTVKVGTDGSNDEEVEDRSNRSKNEYDENEHGKQKDCKSNKMNNYFHQKLAMSNEREYGEEGHSSENEQDDSCAYQDFSKAKENVKETERHSNNYNKRFENCENSSKKINKFKHNHIQITNYEEHGDEDIKDYKNSNEKRSFNKEDEEDENNSHLDLDFMPSTRDTTYNHSDISEYFKQSKHKNHLTFLEQINENSYEMTNPNEDNESLRDCSSINCGENIQDNNEKICKNLTEDSEDENLLNQHVQNIMKNIKQTRKLSETTNSDHNTEYMSENDSDSNTNESNDDNLTNKIPFQSTIFFNKNKKQKTLPFLNDEQNYKKKNRENINDKNNVVENYLKTMFEQQNTNKRNASDYEDDVSSLSTISSKYKHIRENKMELRGKRRISKEKEMIKNKKSVSDDENKGDEVSILSTISSKHENIKESNREESVLKDGRTSKEKEMIKNQRNLSVDRQSMSSYSQHSNEQHYNNDFEKNMQSQRNKFKNSHIKEQNNKQKSKHGDENYVQGSGEDVVNKNKAQIKQNIQNIKYEQHKREGQISLKMQQTKQIHEEGDESDDEVPIRRNTQKRIVNNIRINKFRFNDKLSEEIDEIDPTELDSSINLMHKKNKNKKQFNYKISYNNKYFSRFDFVNYELKQQQILSSNQKEHEPLNSHLIKQMSPTKRSIFDYENSNDSFNTNNTVLPTSQKYSKHKIEGKVLNAQRNIGSSGESSINCYKNLTSTEKNLSRSNKHFKNSKESPFSLKESSLNHSKKLNHARKDLSESNLHLKNHQESPTSSRESSVNRIESISNTRQSLEKYNKQLKHSINSRESSVHSEYIQEENVGHTKFKSIAHVKSVNIVNKIYHPQPIKKDKLSHRVDGGNVKNKMYKINKKIYSNCGDEFMADSCDKMNNPVKKLLRKGLQTDSDSDYSTNKFRDKTLKKIKTKHECSTRSSSSEDEEEHSIKTLSQSKHQRLEKDVRMSNPKSNRNEVESRLSYMDSDRMEVDSRLSNPRYQRSEISSRMAYPKIRRLEDNSPSLSQRLSDEESCISYTENRKLSRKQLSNRFKTSTPSMDSSNGSEQYSVFEPVDTLKQKINVNKYNYSSNSDSDESSFRSVKRSKKDKEVKRSSNKISINPSKNDRNSVETNQLKQKAIITNRYLQNSSESDENSDNQSVCSSSKNQFRKPRTKHYPRDSNEQNKHHKKNIDRPTSSLSIVSDKSLTSPLSKISSTKLSEQFTCNAERKSSIERHSEKSLNVQISPDDEQQCKKMKYSPRKLKQRNSRESSISARHSIEKSIQSSKNINAPSRNSREGSVFSNPRTISRASVIHSEQEFEDNRSKKKSKRKSIDDSFTCPNEPISEETRRPPSVKRDLLQLSPRNSMKSCRNSLENEISPRDKNLHKNQRSLREISPKCSREGSINLSENKNFQETTQNCQDKTRRISQEKTTMPLISKVENLQEFEEEQQRELKEEEIEEYVPSCNSNVIKYRQEKYEYSKKKLEENENSKTEIKINKKGEDLEKDKEDKKQKEIINNKEEKRIRNEHEKLNSKNALKEFIDNCSKQNSSNDTNKVTTKESISGVCSDKMNIKENYSKPSSTESSTNNSSYIPTSTNNSSNDSNKADTILIDNVGDNVNKIKENQDRINKQIEEFKRKYYVTNDTSTPPAQQYYRPPLNPRPNMYQQPYRPYQQIIQRHLFHQQRPRNPFTKINQNVKQPIRTPTLQPLRPLIPPIRGTMQPVRGPLIPVIPTIRPGLQPNGVPINPVIPGMQPVGSLHNPSISLIKPPLMPVNPSTPPGPQTNHPSANQYTEPTPTLPITNSPLIPPVEQYVIKSTSIYKSNAINKKRRKQKYLQKLMEAQKQQEERDEGSEKQDFVGKTEPK